MASHTIAADAVAKHAFALTAATVDTVTIANAESATILSDGTAIVYFTVDGSTPTVGGTNTFVIPAAVSTFEVGPRFNFSGVLKLISAGTPTLHVYRS